MVNYNASDQNNTPPETSSNNNNENNNNISKSNENNSSDNIEAPSVQIKVVNQQGEEIFFKVKMTTPMSRVFQAYCSRSGQSTNSIRFLYDGQRVVPSDTPEKLEFEDGDLIDVVLQQTGGNNEQRRRREK